MRLETNPTSNLLIKLDHDRTPAMSVYTHLLSFPGHPLPVEHLQFYEPFNTGYNFQIFCLCASLYQDRLHFFNVSLKMWQSEQTIAFQ